MRLISLTSTRPILARLLSITNGCFRIPPRCPLRRTFSHSSVCYLAGKVNVNPKNVPQQEKITIESVVDKIKENSRVRAKTRSNIVSRIPCATIMGHVRKCFLFLPARLLTNAIERSITGRLLCWTPSESRKLSSRNMEVCGAPPPKVLVKEYCCNPAFCFPHRNNPTYWRICSFIK